MKKDSWLRLPCRSLRTTLRKQIRGVSAPLFVLCLGILWSAVSPKAESAAAENTADALPEAESEEDALQDLSVLTETGDYTVRWVAEPIDEKTCAVRVGEYYASSMEVELTVPEKIGELSVTEVSEYAFAGGFDSIVIVTLPDTVTSVGREAFAGCSHLKRVFFGDGLVSIGEEAFAGCRCFDRIQIPEKVKTIGAGAFAGCGAEKFRLDPNNKNFSVKDGVLFDSKGKTLLAYPAGKRDVLFRVGTEVTAVAPLSFQGNPFLRRVSFAGKPETIGERAFENCGALRVVWLPASVTKVGDRAFAGTAIRRFTAASENKKLTVSDGVLYQDGVLLAYPPASDREEYQVEDGTTIIGQGAFAGNRALKHVVFPHSLNLIERNAFAFCTALEQVTFPKSLMEIGDGAFEGCRRLTDVRFAGEPVMQAIYEKTFAGCTSLEAVTLPSAVEYIGESAFSGCEALSRVELPHSLVMMAPRAFYGCSALKRLTLPPELETIGEDALPQTLEMLEVYEGSYGESWARLQGAEHERVWEPDELVPVRDEMTEIMEIQTALNALGYDCGKVDGKLGRRTREAIARFRKDAGLPEENIVDEELLEALR